MLFGWYEDSGEVSGAVFRTPPFELLLAVVPEEATAGWSPRCGQRAPRSRG